MAINTYVLTATWAERVRRFVSFHGPGLDAWTSALIKPSCPVVPVPGIGPNNRDAVFVGSVDGWLFMLDFDDGTVLSKMALANWPVTQPVRGIAYADGVVYCTAGDALYAVKPSHGPLWRVGMADLAWDNPVVANGIVYAGSWDRKLYAIHAADGSTAWISEAASFFASHPVVADDIVYAKAWDSLLALNASDGTVLWEQKSVDSSNFVGAVAVAGDVVFASAVGTPNCYAFKTASGTMIWSVNFPGITTAPVVYRDAIFISSGKSNSPGKYLYKLSAANGSTLWVSEIPIGQTGISVAAVNESAIPNVFVTSQDQHIYAFAISDGWFAWKAKIADNLETPIDPTWAGEPLELPLNTALPSAFLERMFKKEHVLARSRERESYKRENNS